MNDDVFWELIAGLDWTKAGDDEAVVRPVVRALAKRPIEDIFRFEDLLAEKLYRLDGEAWARAIGEDAYREGAPFSVDGFLYARCCVVANGRALFEAVLAQPAVMPKDMELEALLAIAADAFARKTKEEEYPHTPTPDYETFSNRAGWPSR